MTAARAGAHQPVGSSNWIAKEFTEISSLCENELEDFTFSARNEVEWLNEHMNEIFLNNRIRLAEILKTPAKLRGRTPRTVRQRSPLKEIRRPLGDIASTDKPFNSPRRSQTRLSPPRALEKLQNIATTFGKHDTKTETQATYDSGYHEDNGPEIEIELPPSQDLESNYEAYSNATIDETTQGKTQQPLPKRWEPAVESHSIEGSFHSTAENQATVKLDATATLSPEKTKLDLVDSENMVVDQPQHENGELRAGIEENWKEPQAENFKDEEKSEQPAELNDIVSEIPTPAQPMTRKGSMSFPALPKRDRLPTSKTSMSKSRVSSQAGYLGRIKGNNSLEMIPSAELDTNFNESKDTKIEQSLDIGSDIVKTDDPRQIQSTSVQSLHERIAALGKPQTSRATKSIVLNVNSSQAMYPNLPETELRQQDNVQTEKDTKTEVHLTEDPNENNWISHAGPDSVPASPAFESITKADEVTRMDPADKRERETAVVLSGESHEAKTNSEASAIHTDSMLKSAANPRAQTTSSKSRLQTLMESARGLFTNSGAISRQAEKEISSTNLLMGRGANDPCLTGRGNLTDMDNDGRQTYNHQDKTYLAHNAGGDSTDDTARTRDDREQLSQAGEMSRQAPEVRAMRATHKPMAGKVGTMSKPNTKPTTGQPIPKLAIKMGAGRRPLPWTSSSASASQKEQDHALGELAATRKESLASTATTLSSASSHKVSASSKTKAMLASERKREAEEKLSQKKTIKSELEKKKIIQQEEAQKREQARQAAERQRERERQATEDRKRQESKEAVERKRAEAHAKREQMQKEHFGSLKTSAFRSEPPRPISRQAMVQDFPKPPGYVSAAKPAPKRLWQPEQEEEETAGSAQSLAAKGVLTAQQEVKRRKTEEVEEHEAGAEKPPAARLPMMQPTRVSTKNNPKTGFFGSNYPRAPPPAVRDPGTIQNTPLDTARFGTGVIPFATLNIQPQPSSPSTGSFKTQMHAPIIGQTRLHLQDKQTLKSSPINGESIYLADIPTDSEEEDSETERENKADLPSWVSPGHLNKVLLAQDSIDPGLVFGPMPILDMEEIFKGRGQRKDFRSRTSSANWFGSDRLTEDEIRRDIEAREKMKRDGGWTFGSE